MSAPRQGDPETLKGPELPGPSDYANPLTGRELHRALIWAGVALSIVLVYVLYQPLLLILAGVVFAQMLEGGIRLLGRVLPIRRGARLAIVAVSVTILLIGFFVLAGTQLASQWQALQTVVVTQVQQVIDWLHVRGILPETTGVREIGGQLMGSFGKVSAFVGSALGAISSGVMILVVGLFIAMEPKLYERGFAWMLPMDRRTEFYSMTERMGHTLRRLMMGRLIGMAVEGVFTGVTLWLVGVPMAPLLGILTGLLAFLPNIGALVSGLLTILVGFSAGFETGLWAVAVYFSVQTIDGYLIVPYVARKSVDLPPALVLGAQLLFGALFGILGLALADPIVAMLKVLLEKKSEIAAEEAATNP